MSSDLPEAFPFTCPLPDQDDIGSWVRRLLIVSWSCSWDNCLEEIANRFAGFNSTLLELSLLSVGKSPDQMLADFGEKLGARC